MAPLHSDPSVTTALDEAYIPLHGVKENPSSGGLSKRSWAGIGVLLIGAVGVMVAYTQGYGPFSDAASASSAPALKQREVDDWIRGSSNRPFEDWMPSAQPNGNFGFENERPEDWMPSAQPNGNAFGFENERPEWDWMPSAQPYGNAFDFESDAYQMVEPAFSSVSASDAGSELFAEDRGSFSHNEMLNSLNSIRRAAGQPPVALHNLLTRAAQQHSDDMARNQFMSHSGSDGSSMGDRINRAGYRFRAAAENVAAGQRDVAGVMRSWTNSNGHYRNMIGSYTHVGFGMARGSDGVRRWTQKFATPR